MPLDRPSLEALLRQAFPTATITLQDLAGDNDHWEAVIVSDAFRGKSRIEQHRMVHAALGGMAGGALHAIKIVTRAPE